MSAEIELCYFCEITNRDGLDQAASIEHHEQWEFRAPQVEGGRQMGRERVRKTTNNDQVKYDLTTKAPHSSENSIGDHEEKIEITEEFFKNWKRAFGVTGQYKTRYTFISNEAWVKYNYLEIRIKDLVFEVDIFTNKDGKRSIFAKVDVEIQDVIQYIKQKFPEVDAAKFVIDFSKLPLGIGKIIPAKSKDPAEQALVKEFFEFFAVPYQEEK